MWARDKLLILQKKAAFPDMSSPKEILNFLHISGIIIPGGYDRAKFPDVS